jgi:putative copper resistance protein D
MLSALTDPLVAGAALAALLTYLASALAIGGVLFLLMFPELPAATRHDLRRRALNAAVLAIIFAALQFPLRAGFLGGSAASAMVNRDLLALVAAGPLGLSFLLKLVGAALVWTLWRERSWSQPLAIIGAILMAASFTQVGHTLSEPRFALMPLLLLHILTLSFWIAALPALHRVLGEQQAGAAAIVARFGRIAVQLVGLLVVAGILLAVLLLKGIQPLFATDYGAILLVKIALVAGLLGMAGYNKLKLTPALEQGSAAAAMQLRFSIRLELLLVVLILAVTALLTTISSPPDL